MQKHFDLFGYIRLYLTNGYVRRTAGVIRLLKLLAIRKRRDEVNRLYNPHIMDKVHLILWPHLSIDQFRLIRIFAVSVWPANQENAVEG